MRNIPSIIILFSSVATAESNRVTINQIQGYEEDRKVCELFAEKLKSHDIRCAQMEFDSETELFDYLWIRLDSTQYDRFIVQKSAAEELSKKDEESLRKVWEGAVSYAIFDYGNDGTKDTIIRRDRPGVNKCGLGFPLNAYIYDIVESLDTMNFLDKTHHPQFDHISTPFHHAGVNFAYLVARENPNELRFQLSKPQWVSTSLFHRLKFCNITVNDKDDYYVNESETAESN